MLAQTPLLLLLGTTVVGREGAEHVMKPGAACQLRQQSFPWSPETLMEPRLTSGGGHGRRGTSITTGCNCEAADKSRISANGSGGPLKFCLVLSKTLGRKWNKVNRRFINLPSSGL